MLKSVVGAFLVFRLELRAPSPLDAGLILLEWLRRPVIEILLRESASEAHQSALHRKLHEVYPF